MIVKKLHELLFPFVKNISKKYIHGELIIENNLSYKGPVIYAVNHTNVSDTPIVFHTLNKQAYIISWNKVAKVD